VILLPSSGHSLELPVQKNIEQSKLEGHFLTLVDNGKYLFVSLDKILKNVELILGGNLCSIEIPKFNRGQSEV
jgi:hypothetical protein